jgi:hypothetical protein
MGPNAFSSAYNGMTHPVVAQFAFVMMKPRLRGGECRDCCWGMIARWEGLTSGTMSGTWGSRRKFLALEKTARSAARKAASVIEQNRDRN